MILLIMLAASSQIAYGMNNFRTLHKFAKNFGKTNYSNGKDSINKIKTKVKNFYEDTIFVRYYLGACAISVALKVGLADGLFEKRDKIRAFIQQFKENAKLRESLADRAMATITV